LDAGLAFFCERQTGADGDLEHWGEGRIVWLTVEKGEQISDLGNRARRGVRGFILGILPHVARLDPTVVSIGKAHIVPVGNALFYGEAGAYDGLSYDIHTGVGLAEKIDYVV